jgi:hypothetical protein
VKGEEKGRRRREREEAGRREGGGVVLWGVLVCRLAVQLVGGESGRREECVGVKGAGTRGDTVRFGGVI